MPDILPAILATDAAEFQERLRFPGFWQPGMVAHIDILDGSMFHATCFHQAASVSHLSMVQGIELHCMVQNPLEVAEAWFDHVPTLKRVIVHREIGRSLANVVTKLRTMNVEVVVAVNPATPVDEIARLPIDALMVMGVEPGASGQAFLGEPILAKMRRAQALFPNLKLAVDGGVSQTTISQISLAGASRCVASSALWKAEKPAEAYKELLNRTR